MELTIEMALLIWLLRARQIANEHHQRARIQVWNPHISMDHVQYVGTPYLNNYNFGWDHHPSLSWEASHNTLHSPQVQRSSLEDTMAKLKRA